MPFQAIKEVNMARLLSTLVALSLLGGCVVYDRGPPRPVYVRPGPVYVVPHYSYHEDYHGRDWR
jgi:hypothetical protein